VTRLGIHTRDRVLGFAKKGMGPSEIARKLGITRQRVHQILKSPEQKPRGRKPLLDEAAEKQVREVLSSNESWTWLEAETALAENGLRVPAMRIFDLLRDLGFTKIARNNARWFKESGKRKR
jgi:transposase